ncbi:MAG: tetratricopeptide repeat protein [Myxococcota bacterium]
MSTCVTKTGLVGAAGLLAVVLAAVGCGRGAGGPVARTAKGAKVVTGSGAELSVEAHNHWQEGLKKFARYEEEGWNDGRCSDAMGSFQKAVKAQAQGKFAEALYMAGLSAARCGDMDEARDFYDEALSKDDKFCKARVAIAVMKLEAGDRADAFDDFVRSVRDDPRCTEGYVNLAIMQRMMGAKHVDEARKNLRRALAIESQHLPAFNELALLFYEEGEKKREQLDLAEVVCRQAQLLDDEYAPIYNTWGLIKLRQGDIIGALRFFEKARALDGSIFEAHMNFGEITLSFRGYEDAKAAFGKAVQLQPKDYEAYLGLGAAYRGLEQYDQAESQYKKAIDINSKRPEAYFNLALIYHNYKSGLIPDLDKAEKYYEQFLERAKNDADQRDTVKDVTRRCRETKGKRRLSRKDCRPGRLQVLEQARDALREMEEMEREAEEMQRQADEQQKQE